MVLAAGGPGRQAGGMDVDTAADELYGLDPDEFMAARTALVAAARQAKDRPAASAIGALKKPTRSAWLVNVLARVAPDRVRRLGELGAELAAAHGAADLARLRALGTERQRLVQELTTDAVASGAERGYQATEAVRSEVAGTFGAAVADRDALADVQAGRVVKALEYSGFGVPMGAPSASAAPKRAAAARPDVEPDEPAADEQRAEQERRAEAQRALEAATEALIEARAMLKAAQTSQAEARVALDRASQEVADLRAELRSAEQAEVAARDTLTASEDEVHEARSRVGQAERTLADAARALD